MNEAKWSKREIELMLDYENKINPEKKEENLKFYDAVLQGYRRLTDAIKDVADPGFAKSIIIQLLRGMPLVRIEDNEEDWELVEEDGVDPAKGNHDPGYSIYQCKRRESLFKKVTYGDEDKNIAFSDCDRSICYDINSGKAYKGGMGAAVFDEMFPITMPYRPTDKIKIFTEDFKYHENMSGDFDTVGVLCFKMPNGEIKEVKRFFKEDHRTHQMVEIDKTEYYSRRKKVENRK